MDTDFPNFTSEIVIKNIWKFGHMVYELMTTSSKYLWKSDL